MRRLGIVTFSWPQQKAMQGVTCPTGYSVLGTHGRQNWWCRVVNPTQVTPMQRHACYFTRNPTTLNNDLQVAQVGKIDKSTPSL